MDLKKGDRVRSGPEGPFYGGPFYGTVFCTVEDQVVVRWDDEDVTITERNTIEPANTMLTKVKIAVPFVQFDVYEIEAPRGLTVDTIVERFDEMRDNGTLPREITYNVTNLRDYNDENGEVYPFIIEDARLDQYGIQP